MAEEAITKTQAMDTKGMETPLEGSNGVGMIKITITMPMGVSKTRVTMGINTNRTTNKISIITTEEHLISKSTQIH